MNHRKQLAALLAAALTLSLCGGAVIATETANDPDAPAQEKLLIAPAPAPETLADAAHTQEEAPAEDAAVEAVPDAEGTVSFPHVAQRVREGNLTARGLGSSIAAIEALDYEEMSDDLRELLNKLASGIFLAHTGIPAGTPGFESGVPADPASATTLQTQYDALRDQFDAIKDGDLQKDNADIVRQLENARNQMAMAGESLYITLIELQQSDATLNRQMAALERGLAELDVRYDMGQVSALTLNETKATKTSLLSGQQTLHSNYKTLVYQLQSMLGVELTGELTLAPLPAVSAAELAAMDLEADLAKAKEASYTLLDAKNTLEDAKEEYKEDADTYLQNSRASYEKEMAYHQWEAAQRTYEAAVQSYELGFRTLYNQVKDCQQVLTAAQTALAVKQDSCAAAQIKFEQGTISEFDLLDAQDTLAAAQDTVNSAAIELFSTYNNYRWAVDHGILN